MQKQIKSVHSYCDNNCHKQILYKTEFIKYISSYNYQVCNHKLRMSVTILFMYKVVFDSFEM